MLTEGGKEMSVSVGELRNGLSRFLNRAAYGGERIIVTSRGNPKAAVISYEDLQLFEDLEDASAAREALAEHRTGETISLEELEVELGLVEATARATRSE